MHPDKTTLAQWQKIYEKRHADAYKRLVASYTEEQRAILKEMTKAAKQKSLCQQRSHWPNGATNTRENQVAWPEDPAIAT